MRFLSMLFVLLLSACDLATNYNVYVKKLDGEKLAVNIEADGLFIAYRPKKRNWTVSEMEARTVCGAFPSLFFFSQSMRVEKVECLEKIEVVDPPVTAVVSTPSMPVRPATITLDPAPEASASPTPTPSAFERTLGQPLLESSVISSPKTPEENWQLVMGLHKEDFLKQDYMQATARLRRLVELDHERVVALEKEVASLKEKLKKKGR